MNNIMDAEFIDVPVEDAYYSTFVVNKYSSTPSIQDSAYSSPRPSPPWPSSKSISDSCSGTWSSPTPSIAYSPSPKPTHYRNIYPTWSSQEGTHYSLQPFTSLNQVQFQADASTYTQGEPAGLPCYQDQYPHTHILDAQALSFAGLGDWTTVEYPRSSSEQILESSPAPSSTTAAIVISRHHSPERNIHPQIKQEEPEEHHHHTCLESSMSKKHTAKATTAYPCPFLPYGCPATFSSKNEWKRHLNTQHLSLSTYRCDLCMPRQSSPSSSSPTQSNDFNRKDLFIQHLRRMHCDATIDSASSVSNPTHTALRAQRYHCASIPNTPAALAEQARRCHIPPPSPPSSTSCVFCCCSFSGPQAWVQRTEHISRHLEILRRDGKEVPAIQDWRRDIELEQWCLEYKVLFLHRSRGGKGTVRVKSGRGRS